MVGWHHWLDGPEFGQAAGIGDGQGSLVCCSLWGHKELDITEQLIELNWLNVSCNLLNTALKVENRMYGYRIVISVLVVYPCDHMADWEVWLAATT